MNFKKYYPLLVIVAAVFILIAARRLGVTNFDAIHLGGSGITGTATPVILANQTGAGAVIELRDGATPVFQVANGGTADFNSNQVVNLGAAGTDFGATGGLTLAAGLTVTAGDAVLSSGTLTIEETDNTTTGTQTITPTTTYLHFAPTAVTTVTIATGSGVEGDLLIIHNIVSTNTVIVDTGATQGGGNVTLGQDDVAGFIFGDGVWVELFSPDNS